MRNKIFILGLDGLEYDLVKKWNLKNFKQQQYGKITVPISEKYGVPDTPQVWASFLTGRPIFKAFKTTSQIHIIFKILEFFKNHLHLSLGISGLIKKIFPKKSWRPLNKGFPPLKLKTFLDYTKSKGINAPYVNFNDIDFVITYKFGIGEISIEKAIQYFNSYYKKLKNKILSEFEKSIKNVNILFAFMHFPDNLEHLLFFRPTRIKDHYLDLDNFISLLKKNIDKSILFIIVSDHGFIIEEGTHSNHGFYSSNIPLEPKPENIMDFYYILTNKKRKKN